MELKELTLKFKTITPLFMYGVEKFPEFKTSEIKGMMRFWWRAIKAEANIAELKKEEAKIFGGTGKGEGKSKVSIKILNQKGNIKDYYLLPHKSNGIAKAIDSNSEIEIEFKILSNHQQIESLIYLSFILGGFGKRARRGFGSFAIEEPKIEITTKRICELLNTIKNIYEIKNNKIINKSEGGNYPWIKDIRLGKGKENYSQLLKDIGESSHINRDFSLGSFRPRMASPVYVSVIKMNNKFMPIITKLNSSFPNQYPRINMQKQQDFIKSIMGE